MSIKCILSFLIAFSILSVRGNSQDAIFAQYYASPLHVNPALTGLIDGSYRLQSSYRDQWKALTGTPFKHFTVGGDVRFNIKKKFKGADLFGAGLSFSSNKVGILDFTTNDLSIFTAYHKLLSEKNKQYLSLGLKMGIVQQGLSYSNLNFQDEFDGINTFDQTSQEVLPENIIGYFDIALGLNLAGNAGDNVQYSLGGAYHHLNGPQTIFTDPNNELFTVGSSDNIKLAKRINLQAITNISLTTFQIISPRLLWTKQGDIQETRLGCNFKFRLKEKKLASWNMGISFAAVTDLEGFSFESSTLMAGINYHSINIGASYDFSIRDGRSSSSLRQRGFELSVTYFGDYTNESLFCPDF